MASARTDTAALEIRKVRKKLRQIENLERLDRDLTDEELNKILKKKCLRENLLMLLAEHGDASTSQTEPVEDDPQTESESSFQKNGEDSLDFERHDVGEITVVEPEDLTNTDLIEVDFIDDIDNQENNNGSTEPQSEEKWHEVKKENVQKPAEAKKTKPIETQNENQSPSKKKKRTGTGDTDTSERSEKSKQLKTMLHNWRFGHFQVTELEGHNDLVTDADTDGRLLVTSSRDTTVKLWSIETLTELRNYGGHSSTVTCVQLLSQQDSSNICSCLELEEVQRILISGSYDCSFKIWSVGTSGNAIKSVYTFNPVTRVIYHPVAQVIITGSDGGKLEMWDILTGDNLESIHPYQDAVTGLKVVDGIIYSCSADGVICVHSIQDKKLNCLFVSENIRCENNGHLTQRHIRGFDVKNNMIYYGDDGTNIKILDWRKGLVHKIVNHCEEFGVTDSICCHGDVLVSSAYSIDNGTGYVNVRHLPEETYVTTLDDEDSGRIVTLSYAESGSRKTVVMGGMQLKVWNFFTEESFSTENGDTVTPRYMPKLAHRHCQDSDLESEMETSDSEDEGDTGIVSGRRKNSSDSVKKDGWLSWCNVI